MTDKYPHPDGWWFVNLPTEKEKEKEKEMIDKLKDEPENVTELTQADFKAAYDEMMEISTVLDPAQAWAQLAAAKKAFDEKKRTEHMDAYDRALLREFCQLLDDELPQELEWRRFVDIDRFLKERES